MTTLLFLTGFKKAFLSGSSIELFYLNNSEEFDPEKVKSGLNRTVRRMRRLKEKFVSVAPYKLKDYLEGHTTLSTAEVSRFTSAETLFVPKLFENIVSDDDFQRETIDARVSSLIEAKSLPSLIVAAINKCPIDYRKVLWQNISLTGGSSRIPNLKGRLIDELKKKAPPGIPVNVRLSDESIYAAVEGALFNFEYKLGNEWVSAEDFEEDPQCLVDAFGLLETAFLPK